jgi:hypothetical protein
MLYIAILSLCIAQLYVRSAREAASVLGCHYEDYYRLGFTNVSDQLTALNMENVLSKG